MKEIFSTKLKTVDLIFALLIIVCIALYFKGINDVPFHPDESTQIFMSEDVRIFFNNPTDLFWKSGNNHDLRQRYHELDAPLTRYLVGLVREITNLPELEADWNWSLSWQENSNAGAMPDERTLYTSRLAIALFYPLSLIGIFLITYELTHKRELSWLSALLYASNALILLHTRRIMAESLLVFLFILSLFLMLKLKKHLWLLAIPIGLAFNAKQTAAPLLIAVSIVFLLDDMKNRDKMAIRKLITNGLLFIASFSLIFFLLNPYLWANPRQSVLDAIQLRSELTNTQIETTASVSPEKILTTPSLKIGNLIAHVYILPAAVADVANYQADQIIKKEAYFNKPFHNLFRNSLLLGGINLLFTLLGVISLLMDIKTTNWPNKATIIIFISAFLLQLIFTLFAFQMTFQRYYILMIPFTCIFPAIVISKTLTIFKEHKKS